MRYLIPERLFEIIDPFKESPTFGLDHIQDLFDYLVLERTFRFVVSFAIHIYDPQHLLVPFMILELGVMQMVEGSGLESIRIDCCKKFSEQQKRGLSSAICSRL